MHLAALVPGRKPGAWSAPRSTSKPARRIENPQRFSAAFFPLRGAAGERKNPRPGAQLRGPRCTGRAWWPVDLVTWAAPAGPVAVVPGAQLFAPRLMSTCAVIRSQVSAWCAVIRGPGDLARGPRPVTWWPLRTGPRPGAGDLVALGRVAWFVITCPRPGGRCL